MNNGADSDETCAEFVREMEQRRDRTFRLYVFWIGSIGLAIIFATLSVENHLTWLQTIKFFGFLAAFLAIAAVRGFTKWLGLFLVCSSICSGGVPDQRARWDAARLNPHYSIALDLEVARFQRLAPRYQTITAMRVNGVPATVLYCLHQRESSGSFLCHPHEGSPLTQRTRFVPKGRLPNKPPPYKFEESAEDAYYVCDKLDQIDWSDVHKALQGIESFNGLGYQKYHPDVPSPYLWAGTTLYSRGKYTGDGKFDRTAMDRQLGCVAILKKMQERGIPLGWHRAESVP